MRKFAASLSSAQISLAREFERAGVTTISQAVKAFERREDARIEVWKRQLAEKRQVTG